MDKVHELHLRIKNACTPLADGDKAIKATFDLVPDSGLAGNRIMPPTYTTDKKDEVIHHFEERFDGKEKNELIAILNQTQGEANRMEECLLAAKEMGLIDIPDVLVKIGDKLRSQLELSHRIYSAETLHSTLDGVPFYESELGRKIYGSDLQIARKAVFAHSPISVLFGCMGSHAGNTQSCLSIPALIENEIIAGVASKTFKASSKGDSLNISKNLVIEQQDAPGRPIRVWKSPETAKTAKKTKQPEVELQNDDKPKKKKIILVQDDDLGEVGTTESHAWKDADPSNAGFGPIPPSLSPRGVSVKWIRDKFTLSIQRTFRYKTGNVNEDIRVRTYLVCLGIYAFLLKTQNYDLRSGCSLQRTSPKNIFEFVKYGVGEPVEISTEEAREMFLIAAEEVKDVLSKETIQTVALKTVEKLVAYSSM